jgi:asparagine synthase (glutamine-hydrolysing)
MCGIAGYYNWRVQPDQLEQLLQSLHHRGPDDNGLFLDDHVGLLHTRLSIIELTKLGAQPYHFDSLVLVFNGELYNYKEVRFELIKKGYSFDSNSDTEVLIKAFHCWREKSVEHFIGMFAFCLYDKQIDTLYIFRDRVGVKPLYFSYQQNSLAFASELKALSILMKDRLIDEEALALFFRFGFIPHHYSIYKSVNKLEPGTYLTLSKDGLKKKRYWNPSLVVDKSRSEEDWLEELEAVAISAFTYRMVSDVPVGIFLSGGIDSSLLASILTQHHGNINSFTIGFNEAHFDESIYARQIAAYLGIKHHERILEMGQARKLMEDFYCIYDEPFADTSGIPTSFVTRLAKEAGMKVVLSADGGDELFGGYSHYNKAFALYHRIQLLPYSMRKRMVQTSTAMLSKSMRQQLVFLNLEHKIYAFEELLLAPDMESFFEAVVANQALPEIETLLNRSFPGISLSQSKQDQTQQSMLMWDFTNYLPDDILVKVDRATMHQSMECREPFLDHRLAELSWKMPIEFKIKKGIGKYPLRKLLSRYMPNSYFDRKKQGFSIPIFNWFMEDMDKLFEDYFSDNRLKNIDILNAKEIQREYRKYKIYKTRNKDYNIEKMWRLLSFMLWWERCNKR